jgi:superfamily I DNA and RNA helicase
MNPKTVIVRGTNDKPAASQSLIESFNALGSIGGQLFIGYPIIGSADGRHPIDAVYVSPDKGVVVFDLVEGRELGDHEDRQDDAATRLQQRLLGYKDLVRRRSLLIGITSVTYAPTLSDRNVVTSGDYLAVNAGSLAAALEGIQWEQASKDLYERTLSAIQNISTIRRSQTPRVIENQQSRGAKLQRLESSIATLDSLQSKAVIETVDGVQRIRGLAGSGKTIVLALKAAYLHAQHPYWRIAVTFNTRSLKAHFHRLINSFVIESTGEEPNWSNVRIINSWGAPGGGNRDGLYYEFCFNNGAAYRDFNAARAEFGRDNAFHGACTAALVEVASPRKSYDAILVDEAQDLPPAFLRMCYEMLDDDQRRLVYAYDELQNLSGQGLPSAEEIFGRDKTGRPRVTFDASPYDHGARRDIVLEKCYRNSRPVLVSAHGLGFGVYREPSRMDTIGLVQMFDQPSLWTDIGYLVKDGELTPGSHVTLARSENSSPAFLEMHSAIDDLVQFITFQSQQEQDTWVADQIERNLGEDELRYDDIVVINTDPLRTRANLGPIRQLLLERSIPNHLAGVDTVADVFFQPESNSITFTGIYRAKGNEAGMVYIVNADECQSGSANLARLRNRLFTAITRSKAWVRVLGVGRRMTQLTEEYQRIKDADFTLSFKYPTAEERETIQVIHRDMTAGQEADLNKRRATLESLLEDLESGRLYREDLDPDVLERLSSLLGKSGR